MYVRLPVFPEIYTTYTFPISDTDFNNHRLLCCTVLLILSMELRNLVDLYIKHYEMALLKINAIVAQIVKHNNLWIP